MLNKGVLCLLIAALALLASPALAPPAAAAATIVVDDDASDCVDGSPPDHPTITAALAVAASGDTIRVCEGDYTESSFAITDDYLTITGPGATPENDGVATVHHNGGSSAIFTIQADYVVLQGLDLDAMPPGGFGADTGGIEIQGNGVEIGHNEIRNATQTAVSASGGTSNTRVLNNNIHDNEHAVVCFFSSGCVVAGNTINVADRAVDIVGDGGNVTNNVITHGYVKASGNNMFISTNQMTGPSPYAFLLFVAGSSIGVTDNTFSDSAGYGIEVDPGAAGTDVTIARNTFTRLETPIYFYDSDPSDGVMVAATIGGSASDANTFVESAGNLGDFNYLLYVDGPTLPIDAEYNNWGLCTLAEIEQEIYHQVDDSAQGLVDFDPFIPPSDCSAPTPAPTATPPATPTPGGRVITIPAGSWANFTWTGDSSPQTVADCFGAGNISVMYRLDAATQSYQRWIGGRPDLSDMGQVAQYDTLLALNSSSQQVSCTPPDVMLLGRTVTVPAGKWGNFAWSGNLTLSPQEVADCFAQGNMSVMYRLDPTTQTYERWIRGRPELTTMGDIAPFDAILALNASSQQGSCDVPILVT